jgi:peptidoglycan hydrolase-like protein with peptidoglycan-binding domain
VARVLGSALLVVLLGALVAGSRVQTPAQRAAGAAAPPPSVVTAEVEKGTVTDAVSVRAVLRAEHLTVVAYTGGRGEGRAVVSGLSTGVGGLIGAGDVAVVVSGRPLIALPGAVQGYRDLRYGSRGPDVDQLRVALAGLGYRVDGDDRSRYGPATAAAVRALYDRLGFDAPVDPALAGGDDPDLAVRAVGRAFDGAVRRADAAAGAVTRAGEELAAARAASGAGSAPARAAEAAYRSAVDAATEAKLAVAEARDARDRAVARRRLLDPGMYLPMAELVFVPRLPARVLQVGVALGQPVAGEIMRLGSGRVRAVATVPPEQAANCRVGTAAEVELADGTRVAGRVSELGPADAGGAAGGAAAGATGGTAPPAPGAGAAAGTAADAGPGGGAGVTVAPDRELPSTVVGQPVTVRLTVRASPPDSLVVPVAAIHDDGAGRTWVRVAAGTRTVDVPVEVGLVAGGRSAVVPSGATLAAGDRVVVDDPRRHR